LRVPVRLLCQEQRGSQATELLCWWWRQTQQASPSRQYLVTRVQAKPPGQVELSAQYRQQVPPSPGE
jgi:hypothetical protein